MSHLHSIYDTDLHFIIDPVTRKITSESGKVTLMQKDHNSERFTFELPRFIEGHDMSLTDQVQIHYINLESVSPKRQNKDVYPVVDVQVSPDSDDVVIFSWLISGNATQYVGSLNFIIRFVCHDENSNIEYQWWSDVYAQIKIAATLDNSGEIVNLDNTDVLESWRQQCILAVETSGVYEKAEALAKSYATGGTGTREGEDTDNAKYYMEKAKEYVGTDFTELVDALNGDEIYRTITGELLHAEDVSNGVLRGMQLFGKTVSDTEGTIDAPSTLYVPGADGPIGVTLTKKNLWTYSTTKTHNNLVYSEEVYTVNGACSASVHTLPVPIPAGTPCAVTIQFTGGKLSTIAGGITIGGYNVDDNGNSWQCAVEFPKYTEQDMNGIKLTTAEVVVKPVTDFFIFFYGPSITIHEPVSFKVTFEIADAPTGYQAYSAQAMAVTPPSELAGIKIGAIADNRWANHFDAYGNAWMSDMIDFRIGIHRKHITKFVFDGTEAWYVNNTTSAKTNRFMLGSVIQKTPVGGPVYGMVSNIATFAGISVSSSFDTENQCMAYGFNSQKGWLGFAVNPTTYPDVDTFKARLAELYAAGTPVVAYVAERIAPTATALSEDQIAAFKALQSYYSVLNAFNDSGAEMSVTCRVDQELYKEHSGIPIGEEMYLGKNEVATQAAEDALGNNIVNTYQRKDEVLEWKDQIDNIQTTSKATLSQAGWYRVAEYEGTSAGISGNRANSCNIILRRVGDTNAGTYELYLNSTYNGGQEFGVERVDITPHVFTKIRYSYDTTALKSYIEVYSSVACVLHATISDGADDMNAWKAITPTLTSETLDGVTVTTTYDIPANASPVTDLDINKLVDGTTTVGNANKLGGKDASEYALKTTVNGVEIGNGGSVTVYDGSYNFWGRKTISTEGWYRIAKISNGSRLSYILSLGGIWNTGRPTATNIIINTMVNTAPIITQISGQAGTQIPKIRCVWENTSWCYIELYCVVSDALYASLTSILHKNEHIETYDYVAGSIPDGYTATEFELSSNPIKASGAEFTTLNGGTPLTSGNYSDYALPKSGGTVHKSGYDVVELENTSYFNSFLTFKGTNGKNGGLGFNNVDKPSYINSAQNAVYELHHDGNSVKMVISETPLTDENTVRIW